jgi:hypothetical protein
VSPPRLLDIPYYAEVSAVDHRALGRGPVASRLAPLSSVGELIDRQHSAARAGFPERNLQRGLVIECASRRSSGAVRS